MIRFHPLFDDSGSRKPEMFKVSARRIARGYVRRVVYMEEIRESRRDFASVTWRSAFGWKPLDLGGNPIGTKLYDTRQQAAQVLASTAPRCPVPVRYKGT